MSFGEDLFNLWKVWPNHVVNTLGGAIAQWTGNSAGWQQWIKEQQAREKSWNDGGSLYSNVWNDLTGRTNTDVANSATAALQEDAQAFNAEEAQKQRDFESAEAQINRDWQEEMASTEKQRLVADYRAAGLNPWLAVGSGGSVSAVGTASGDSASSAQGQGINATKSGAEVLQGVAITAAVMMKLIKLLK